MVTRTSGNRKNSAKTSIIGPAWSHAIDLRSCFIEGPLCSHTEGGLPRRLGRGKRRDASSGDEFVPLADHVVVLVHHGVPAGDATHAVVIGAAVADGAGLLECGAIRRLDVADGGVS